MTAGLLLLASLGLFQGDRVGALARELRTAISGTNAGEINRISGELGLIGTPESLRALADGARGLWPGTEAGREPSPSLFQTIVLNMRGMASPTLVPAWIELVGDRIAPLRALAIDVLTTIRDPSQVEAIDAAAYGRIARERDPRVIQSLNLMVRTHRVRSQAGLGALIAGLRTDDRDLRILCVQALAQCTMPGQEERIELALARQAVREPDSWVQAYAVYLMRDHVWISEEAIQTLALAVPRTREIDLRVALLETLANARSITDGLLEALRTGLGDGRCPVIAAAAQAMRKLDVRSTTPELIDALRNAEPHLREELCDVLRALTGYVYRNHSGWRIWWETFGESYLARTYEPPAEPPPDTGLESVEEPGRRHVGYCPRCGAIPTFFGAPIDSLHVVFLVDRSGSMGSVCPWRRDPRTVERHPPQLPPEPAGNTKMDILKWELAYATALMPNYALVNMAAYEGALTPWKKDGPVLVGPETRRSAIEFVNALCSGGDTNIHCALQWAFRQEGIDTIFLMSDGQPTVGEIVRPEELIAAVAQWQREREVPLRIHTMFLGTPEEAEGIAFLREMAARNQGRFFDCSQ